jgi:hypothetical protein
MRILVADKNALLLAAVCAAFGRHCELVTGTGRDECMDQVERQRFDVVVACDELTDYTGLELLSEVASISPGTLLILAASPARLRRLGSRLALFGLFETLSYPPGPRQLLETLKRARQHLPPSTAPKVPHVILESEWDTGERLSLVEQELQTSEDSKAVATWLVLDTSAEEEVVEQDMVWSSAPKVDSGVDEVIELPPSAIPVLQEPVSNDSIPESTAAPNASGEAPVEQEPQWDEEGAANDAAFEPDAAAGDPSKPSSGGAKSSQPAKSPLSASPSATEKAAVQTGRTATGSAAGRATQQPRVRAQTVPSAAQRAAFERALARRKAGGAGAQEDFNSEIGSASAPFNATASGTGRLSVRDRFAQAARSSSLPELARRVASKRPLAVPDLSRPGPKRAAFAVGSGLAAAIILGVLTFELLRTPDTAHAMPGTQTANTVPFSPRPTLVANGEAPPPFSAPPQQSAAVSATTSSQPQAQTFNPDTAPPDPPPPPAVEQPGPMEPPDTEPPMPMHGIRLPPTGMLPPGYEQEYGPQ